MRLIVILFVVCISFLVVAPAQAATVDMQAEVTPDIQQFVGSGSVELAAAKYPNFKVTEGRNWAACTSYVESLSGDYRPNQPVWSDIITRREVGIDARYRNTGKILVTWNVRIIGGDSPVGISPGLCQFFVGKVQQSFKGGSAYTQLLMSTDGTNWTVLGSPIGMTLPDGGVQTIAVNNPPPPPRSDPSHTGSYLITGKNFDGKLPAKIYLKVQWKNDTALRLVTGDKERSLIANITRE